MQKLSLHLQLLLFYLLRGHDHLFLEKIDLSETHCGESWLVVVDNMLSEFIIWVESVFIFSGYIHEFVWKDLDYLCTWVRSVSFYFPLEKVLLRMELDCIYWIVSCLNSWDKFFIVGRCWDGGQFPEGFQEAAWVEIVSSDSKTMIEIYDSLPIL